MGATTAGELADRLTRFVVDTLETHQDPDNAPSDGPNMVPLEAFESLMADLQAIDAVAKRIAADKAG